MSWRRIVLLGLGISVIMTTIGCILHEVLGFLCAPGVAITNALIPPEGHEAVPYATPIQALLLIVSNVLSWTVVMIYVLWLTTRLKAALRTRRA